MCKCAHVPVCSMGQSEITGSFVNTLNLKNLLDFQGEMLQECRIYECGVQRAKGGVGGSGEWRHQHFHGFRAQA